jgi:hypothetical protein
MPFATQFSPLATHGTYSAFANGDMYYQTYVKEVAWHDASLMQYTKAVNAAHQNQALGMAQPPRQPPIANVFSAYCNFLKARRWKYDTGAGVRHENVMTERQLHTAQSLADRGIPFSPYALPRSPIVNCYEASLGLMYALRKAGVSEPNIEIVTVLATPETKYAFAYRGHGHARTRAVTIRYDHQFVGAKVNLSNQGVLSIEHPITHDDAGIPFPNHMLVRCEGIYWDPTLGIGFGGTTADAFEDYQLWENERFSLYKRAAAPQWVAKIDDNMLLRDVHAMLSNAEHSRFFFDESQKSTNTFIGNDLLRVPLALWYVINADKIALFRACLAKAITNYEGRSATLFRNPSVNSRDALIRIRKYLGTGLQPDKGKYKRHNQEQKRNVEGEAAWTHAQAAEHVWLIVNPANRANNPVGDSLRDALTKACKADPAVWEYLSR